MLFLVRVAAESLRACADLSGQIVRLSSTPKDPHQVHRQFAEGVLNRVFDGHVVDRIPIAKMIEVAHPYGPMPPSRLPARGRAVPLHGGLGEPEVLRGLLDAGLV